MENEHELSLIIIKEWEKLCDIVETTQVSFKTLKIRNLFFMKSYKGIITSVMSLKRTSSFDHMVPLCRPVTPVVKFSHFLKINKK